MSACHVLESQFEAAWPAGSWGGSHVVLAVSGGPDSVALLRAALTLKSRADGTGKLFVAHLNHTLRGDDADADEAWLHRLCERLDVPLESARANVEAIATAQGNGLEAAARAARYQFLQDTAERLGARLVATAHTADDQAETVLHRIVRGTGLAGLAGMPQTRALSPSVTLVRPLLGVRRHTVLDYLNTLDQDYRTDATNANLRWTRNRLRHELLPTLRECFNENVDDALLRLAAQADEAQHLIAEETATIAAECVSIEQSASPGATTSPETTLIRIACAPLLTKPPLVVREVFKLAWSQARWPQQAMGYHEWQQLATLARCAGGAPTINLPGNIRAQRVADDLILERLSLG